MTWMLDLQFQWVKKRGKIQISNEILKTKNKREHQNSINVKSETEQLLGLIDYK